jgi:hypothetical protein
MKGIEHLPNTNLDGDSLVETGVSENPPACYINFHFHENLISQKNLTKLTCNDKFATVTASKLVAFVLLISCFCGLDV